MPWPLATRARNLAACGYTGAEVAAELGVSCRQRLYRLVRGRFGLRAGRPRDPAIRAAVMAGVELGLTTAGIARRMGRTWGAAYRLLVELEADGLARRSDPGWRPGERWTEVRPCECQHGRRHQHGRAKA
jgi:hypothetical protein